MDDFDVKIIPLKEEVSNNKKKKNQRESMLLQDISNRRD